MNAEVPQENHELLSALALALVEKPRASLQELAQAVGISKATLYRFSPTREQLIERLIDYSTRQTTQSIDEAGLETAPPLEALANLTAARLDQQEVTLFLMQHWMPDGATDPCEKAGWKARMDTFFLKGQQEGLFAIDIPAPVLTEIWVSMLLGLIDAEYRGRVARASLAGLLERVFLNGVKAN